AVAGRINKIVGKTRGINEKLLRHAAADHAGTADAVFFRDHDARAVLARNARGAHATRSRTNDEKVEVVVGHRRLLTLDDADAARAGENSGLRQTDEQPVLYNTGNAAKLRGQRLRIGNALERGIKDPVAAVSADDVAFLVPPQLHRAGRANRGGGRIDLHPRCSDPEWHDFDRQRKAADSGDPFAFIGDDDHAFGRRGDDLFAQQRATTAFDQVEFRTDLVGAVDGKVQFRRFIERGERDAKTLGLRARRFRSGHADDFAAVAQTCRQQIQEVLYRGAGAQAQPHARFDELHRA